MDTLKSITGTPDTLVTIFWVSTITIAPFAIESGMLFVLVSTNNGKWVVRFYSFSCQAFTWTQVCATLDGLGRLARHIKGVLYQTPMNDDSGSIFLREPAVRFLDDSC